MLATWAFSMFKWEKNTQPNRSARAGTIKFNASIQWKSAPSEWVNVSANKTSSRQQVHPAKEWPETQKGDCRSVYALNWIYCSKDTVQPKDTEWTTPQTKKELQSIVGIRCVCVCVCVVLRIILGLGKRDLQFMSVSSPIEKGTRVHAGYNRSWCAPEQGDWSINFDSNQWAMSPNEWRLSPLGDTQAPPNAALTWKAHRFLREESKQTSEKMAVQIAAREGWPEDDRSTYKKKTRFCLNGWKTWEKSYHNYTAACKA